MCLQLAFDRHKSSAKPQSAARFRPDSAQASMLCNLFYLCYSLVELIMLVSGPQGSSRRRHSVLSAAFRGWQEEVQLQQYRRHVVVILSHKVNNGLLLKAFNCWRCACSCGGVGTVLLGLS